MKKLFLVTALLTALGAHVTPTWAMDDAQIIDFIDASASHGSDERGNIFFSLVMNKAAYAPAFSSSNACSAVVEVAVVPLDDHPIRER